MDAKLLTEQGVRRYAAISAQLRAAPPARSGDILARHGLTPDLWQDSARAWTQAIEEELTRENHDLLLAYAEELRATERRLAQEPLVFETSEPAAPAPTPPPPPVPPPPPPPPIVATPIGITAPVDVQAILAARLPFQASAAQPPVAQPTPPSHKKPRKPSGTLLDAPAPPVIGLPLPSAARGDNPTPSPELTFEQYVALCSELTVSPDRSGDILAKAQVAPSALPALHDLWRKRLAADAELTRRWHGLYAHYVDWFTKSR